MCYSSFNMWIFSEKGMSTITSVGTTTRSLRSCWRPSAPSQSPRCGWAPVSWSTSGPSSTALDSTLSSGWPNSSPSPPSLPSRWDLYGRVAGYVQCAPWTQDFSSPVVLWSPPRVSWVSPWVAGSAGSSTRPTSGPSCSTTCCPSTVWSSLRWWAAGSSSKVGRVQAVVYSNGVDLLCSST